jgi:hypothetical protein
VTYSKTPLRDYYYNLHLRRRLSVAISGRQSHRRGVRIGPEERRGLSTTVHSIERGRGEWANYGLFFFVFAFVRLLLDIAPYGLKTLFIVRLHYFSTLYMHAMELNFIILSAVTRVTLYFVGFCVS